MSPVPATPAPGTVAAHLHEQPEVLAHQRAVLPAAVRAAVAAADAGATTRVLLVGSGTSHHAARLARPSAARPARVLVPGDALHGDGDLGLGPDLLVVGVSQSGRSTGTRAVLDRARAAGSPTLLVTGDPGPAGPGGPAVLDVACGPERVGPKTKGFTATVVALHLLLRMLDDPAGASLAGLDDLAARVRAVLADAASAVAAVCARPAPESVHVVTWGRWRPVADEGALKVLETARVPVDVWDVEEFLHGPHRRLGPGSLLVVVGDGDAPAVAAEALAAFVVEIGGRVLQVRTGGPPTDPPGTTGDRHVRVGVGDGPAAPLVAVVALQLLAVALTTARGLTPEDDVHPGFHTRLGSKTPEGPA